MYYTKEFNKKIRIGRFDIPHVIIIHKGIQYERINGWGIHKIIKCSDTCQIAWYIDIRPTRIIIDHAIYVVKGIPWSLFTSTLFRGKEKILYHTRKFEQNFC